MDSNVLQSRYFAGIRLISLVLLLLLLPVGPSALSQDTGTAPPTTGEALPDPSLLEPIIEPDANSASQPPEAPQSNPSPLVKTRTLQPGDNYIHGFLFADGYLWGSTRTTPARILKIDPHTLNTQPVELAFGLDEAEALVYAEGALWATLSTQPGKVVRIDPNTLATTVEFSFDYELDNANSAEYAFGYLWVGGANGRLARIDLENNTYEIYILPSMRNLTLLHALKAGGNSLWVNVVHYSWFTGQPTYSSILKVDPHNPLQYSVVRLDAAVADDMAYVDEKLVAAGENDSAELFFINSNMEVREFLVASDAGSYGVFNDPWGGKETYTTIISEPGRAEIHRLESDGSLSKIDAYSFPADLNHSNEIAFDPVLGFVYVTTWTEPVTIGKYYAPSHWQGERPFLDLPIAYGDFSTAALGNLGDSGGRVNSWFDHDQPNYGTNGRFARWDGVVYTGAAALHVNTCNRDSCYEGHDGIDFSHDRNISSEPVYAAAEGTVVECPETDCPFSRSSLGNFVLLEHDNHFATLYGHLARVDVEPGSRVRQGARIGTMGSTGNSTGIHLHFGVYHDENGDNQWTPGEVYDPYGYPSHLEDPHALRSQWLWLQSFRDRRQINADGGSLTTPSGRVVVTVPPHAVDGEYLLEVSQVSPPASPFEWLRSIGLSFLVGLFSNEAGDEDGAVSLAHTSRVEFSDDVQLTVDVSELSFRHLDPTGVQIMRYDSAAGEWSALSSSYDPATEQITAYSSEAGSFDVQAPLLCVQDRSEPNDYYDEAVHLGASGGFNEERFDSRSDEDWYALSVNADVPYKFSIETLSQGNAHLTVWDSDGITQLRSGRISNSGSSVEVIFDEAATIFVSVVQGNLYGGTPGCDTEYRLTLATSESLYLPAIRR